MSRIVPGARVVLGVAAMTAAPLMAATPGSGVDDAAPGTAVLRVEIPAGSAIKYEFDTQGRLFVDRFLPGNEVYPANYGGLPGTLAGDGDPLDALVITRQPILPGAHITFRPVAVLYLWDGGKADDKLVGVPVDTVDAEWSSVMDLGDLPEPLRQRIAAFFDSYKRRPGIADSPVQVLGWGGAGRAQELLEQARKAAR